MGLVLRIRPPVSYDAAALERRAAHRGVEIRREAGLLVVELPGDDGRGEPGRDGVYAWRLRSAKCSTMSRC